MPPVMSTLKNASAAPSPGNTTNETLLSHLNFTTQMQKLCKSSSSSISTSAYENYCNSHTRILRIHNFLATQKNPRVEILHQIAHRTCLVFAQGHPVNTIIANGMLTGQVQWVILYPGRITFDYKYLNKCDTAKQGILPTANPLVVSCLANATREWQVALRAVHSKRNKERILDAARMRVYIHRRQCAGLPISPEDIARIADPRVERMGYTYVPEVGRLVEMMKEVLEEGVKEIVKREERCRKRGVTGSAQRGLARDLSMARERMLKPQIWTRTWQMVRAGRTP